MLALIWLRHGEVSHTIGSLPPSLASSSGGLLILDTDPGAVRWSDFGEGTVVTLSGGTDVDEPADGGA